VVTRARDGVPLVRDIEHTADAGFEVEAPTLGELFERAALAMLGVMADLTTVDARERITLAVTADGLTELLHDFLSRLLVHLEVDGFLACELSIGAVDDRHLAATAGGERVDPSRHRLYGGVKAVTYHQLEVRETDHGWWARVILDV
jgi:SHS2 domain-containing protein